MNSSLDVIRVAIGFRLVFPHVHGILIIFIFPLYCRLIAIIKRYFLDAICFGGYVLYLFSWLSHWGLPQIELDDRVSVIRFVYLSSITMLLSRLSWLRSIKVAIGSAHIHSAKDFMHLISVDFVQSTKWVLIKAKTCRPFKMRKSIIFEFLLLSLLVLM